MPHKRNPITAERLCGLARILRGNLLAGLEDVALWHERDISHSSVERVILPDSTLLAHYVLVKGADLVDRMVVDRTGCDGISMRASDWCSVSRSCSRSSLRE
jgi:adenylosuccinate lyase